ncbi:golgin subfamily A member 6-like protein 2 [Pecten maximus]|uniref:golgin subfamily A member 6-like protein 2 n=1 Tax=Pecten maximus TaxID=6579 RepID=UPI0014585980|nr:golgin subfamily A member 6-like protein 2 [Pecten maximus]
MGRKMDRVRRLFSNQRILKDIKETQDILIRRISHLLPDQSGHEEYKEKLKESEKELKQSLEKAQRRERKLEAEIHELTKQIHQLDLEVVRLKMESQHLTNDKTRLSHQLDELRESLKECKHSVKVLETHKADLKDECSKHIDLIREHERNLEMSDVDRRRLNGMLETKEEMLQKIAKDRGKLLVYLKKQGSRHEEHLCLIREQFRRRLAQAYKDRNDGKSLTLATNGNEMLLTRLMEAEFKIYRRERLVDVLADKLRQYEEDFDVGSAAECMPYLDGDYRGASVADLSRGNSDLTCSDESELFNNE